jgi:rubrerythrin
MEYLELQRHHRIIYNILALGLFDNTQKALDALAVHVLPGDSAIKCYCSSCGKLIEMSFCPDCGVNKEYWSPLPVSG